MRVIKKLYCAKFSVLTQSCAVTLNLLVIFQIKMYVGLTKAS